MEEPHVHSEVVLGVTDISMLVTLKVEAFVVTTLVEDAECE
jgi:hypothetical protein